MDDGLRLEGADEAGREERNDKESGEGEGKERGDNGGSQMLPRRVAIKVKVTDIEGEPVGRVPTMARIFASAVFKRNFNFDPNARPRDQMHFLPRFDSPNPVEAWFLYDFNYDDRVQQDLARIPHDVYLASFVNGIWIFTRRDFWSEGARDRVSIHRWGGPPSADAPGQTKIPIGPR